MPFTTPHLRNRLFIVLLILSALFTYQTQNSTAQQDTTVPSPVNFNAADIEAAWADYQSRYISSEGAGAAPRVRVYGGVSLSSTVSEGQAYGMLYASIFDEQNMLDGLWLFAADHLDQNGLMHWRIDRQGNTVGTGGATDADVDMAMALVIACEKTRNGTWDASPNGLDYCALATTLIDNIWQHEIDKPGPEPAAGLDNNIGYELIPGDLFNLSSEYPNGLVNLSYFAPGYFRVFAEFTGNDGWYQVIQRNYDIAEAAEQIQGNCSSLVPNWSQYNGQIQRVPWHGETSDYFGWDGGRFAWRIAVDNYWYGDSRADATLNKIGGFFSSVGMGSVGSEYRLNGTAVNAYRTPYFLSMAASAIWGATEPIPTNCGDASGNLISTPQQAYDTILNISPENYYNDSWRLLTMMLMTGYFANPLSDAVTPVTPQPATPTPQPTDSVQPTNTPNIPPTPMTPPATVPPADNPPNTSVEGCDVNVAFGNQWNAGYVATITIRNTSDTPIEGWTLNFNIGNSVSITNAWNVQTTGQINALATATSNTAHYNGTIPARGTVSFGYRASHNGNISTPDSFVLNGVGCNGVSAPANPQPTQVVNTPVAQPTTQPTTAPANTPVPPATATTAPVSDTSDCAVTISFNNEWNTGYTANIIIRNNGSAPIQNWTLTFNIGAGVSVSNSWGSATQTQAGNTVTMSSSGNHYNATINPGQEVTLGYNAAHGGTYTLPTAIQFNNQAC